MNGSDVVLTAQVDALLRRIGRERESRCRMAREDAEHQAAALLQRARQEARERVREAVREARGSIAVAVRDRRAALDTTARRAEQLVLRRVLDAAWGELPAALEARWRDPGTRRAWCHAAATIASALLCADAPWRVQIDPDSPEDVREDTLASLGESVAPAATFERVPGLGPGLRVRRGRACLDATVDGLLSSRERIEAELLARLDPAATPAPEEPPA